jgi:phage protein D
MDNHTPEVEVKLKGQTKIDTDSGESLDTRGGKGILSVHVDLRLDSPDMFSVEYDMMALEKLNLIDAFEVGTEVSIALGLEEKATIATGEIAYVEPSFDVDAGFRTTITGYHKSHRLTRGQSSKTWGDGVESNQQASTQVQDVVNKAAATAGGKTSDGFSIGSAGKSKVKRAYVPQLNASDYAFLQGLGAGGGLASDPDDPSKLEVVDPSPQAAPTIKLVRERADMAGDKRLILAASFRQSTVNQYSEVVVRSWDPGAKKNIVGVAKSTTLNFGGTDGKATTGKGFWGSGGTGKKYVVTDQPVSSQEEADALAQSIFDQQAMDFLTGEVTIRGNPKARPGQTLEFEGFGKVYDGTYLITSAVHSFRPEEGYRTTIGFSRTGQGK